MNSPSIQTVFYIGALIFGVPFLWIIPVLIRLLSALISGAVKWPGPIIHEANPRVTLGRLKSGLSPHHLFSTFIFYALGLGAMFFVFIIGVLSNTTLFSGYIYIRETWETTFVYAFMFIAGAISLKNAIIYRKQVNAFLSELASRAEPRQFDAESAEAEYSIEHPLIEHQMAGSDAARALILFSEATKYFQTGDQQPASMLFNEAMALDPSLHEHAREALSKMAQDCSPMQAGPIYYWLGAHSEYLFDWQQAAIWYKQAILAFREIGYQKRESRGHCNLGNVKMKTGDDSAIEEFEKAIVLNPRNGTAHLNIARAYYRISQPGDYRYDLALNAFADAIIADPPRYGPLVISYLRELGYTWQEDLEKITQRVESKRAETQAQAS